MQITTPPHVELEKKVVEVQKEHPKTDNDPIDLPIEFSQFKPVWNNKNIVSSGFIALRRWPWQAAIVEELQFHHRWEQLEWAAKIHGGRKMKKVEMPKQETKKTANKEMRGLWESIPHGRQRWPYLEHHPSSSPYEVGNIYEWNPP